MRNIANVGGVHRVSNLYSVCDNCCPRGSPDESGDNLGPYKLWLFFLFSFLFKRKSLKPFHCSLPPKATSSGTKEDHSAEEHDNEGEIPGPPGQAPAGGPTAAHGGQAGGVLPAELGLGAGGQHRDLYSRGSDSTLRRRGPGLTRLPASRHLEQL